MVRDGYANASAAMKKNCAQVIWLKERLTPVAVNTVKGFLAHLKRMV
jgi:hypothetical protein